MGTKLQRLICLLATGTALLAAGCGGGGGGSGGGGSGEAVFSADGIHFPFDAGDRWLYGPPSGGSLVLQKSGGTRSLPGATARAMQSVNLADGSRSTSYYSADASGVREHLPDAVDPVSRALDGLHVVRWPANAGDSFVLLDRTIDIGEDYDGDGRSELVALRMDLQVIGRESVDTPAGRFADAARQRLTLRQTLLPTGGSTPIAIVAVNESWFAPGIGLVRNSVSVRGAGLDEDITSVLRGYRIGALTTDSAAPVVQSVSPQAASVTGISASVGVVFSEPIDPDSVAPGGLQVLGVGGVPVAGSTQAQERGLRFTPTQGWTSGTYAAEVGASVTDLLGNPLEQPYRWQFDIDVSGPALLSSEPASNAVDVALDTAIVLRLSEPPDTATVRVDTVELWELGPNAAAVPVTLSVAGDVVTLRPTSPLRAAATYEVRVNGVTDALGNAITLPTALMFQTVQGRFSYPQRLLADDFRWASAIGDVNGDGINDVLITASPSGGAASLYLRQGQPDGSLAVIRSLALDPALSCFLDAVAIGDLNGDGRNDVVVGAAYCGAQVLLQGTDGSLVPGAVLQQAAASRLRIADLDGDGRNDLLGTGGGQNEVLFWRQNSAGQLEAPRSIPVGSAVDLAVADLNGDGRLDIVAALGSSTPGNVAVVLQQADGTFASPVGLSTGSTWGASSIAVGDFNGDGRTDIAASTGGNTPTFIVVWLQAANGTMGAPVRLDSHDIPVMVRAADIDGDGRTDLVVGHTGWMKVGIYLQTSGGSLAAEELYAAPYGNFTPDLLALGDINRDGRTDIVIDGHALLQRAAAAPAANGVRPGVRASPWPGRMATPMTSR